MLFANELPGEELWQSPQKIQLTEVQKNESQKIDLISKNKTKSNIRIAPKSETKNLPIEYLTSLTRQSTTSELVQPAKGSTELFRGLKVGDILDLNVLHSVIAFPDEKSPVIGLATSGPFSGLKFIGESYLEKNSKRIFINFTRLVVGQIVYDLKGVGVTSEGQPGLSGEYHSREAEYFAGDFLASFMAGYFDGQVPRRTNAFGQIEADTSIDSAVKKGLAAGALSTADRFREKIKKVPEFSEIKGPFQLKILILDQAKTTNQ